MPASPAASVTVRTSAPAIVIAFSRLGQHGETATTLSPGPTSAWASSTTPFIPELVSATRSSATGRPYSRRR